MHIIKFYEMNQFVNYKTVREGSLVTKVTEFYNIITFQSQHISLIHSPTTDKLASQLKLYNLSLPLYLHIQNIELINDNLVKLQIHIIHFYLNLPFEIENMRIQRHWRSDRSPSDLTPSPISIFPNKEVGENVCIVTIKRLRVESDAGMSSSQSHHSVTS